MHNKERGVPVIFGSAVGHGVPGVSVTVSVVLFFLPASPPLHRSQGGGNAPLIYHSSALTIWSRSDNPHLASPASSFCPNPSLSPLFVSVLAHHCICSVSLSVSLSLLGRSAFVFASLHLTLTSTQFKGSKTNYWHYTGDIPRGSGLFDTQPISILLLHDWQQWCLITQECLEAPG